MKLAKSVRPVTFLPVLGKLFERVLLKPLNSHIAEKGLISPKQYGFQKGKSATDLLVHLTEQAKNSIFPKIWKQGKLIVIPKGGDRDMRQQKALDLSHSYPYSENCWEETSYARQKKNS